MTRKVLINVRNQSVPPEAHVLHEALSLRERAMTSRSDLPNASLDRARGTKENGEFGRTRVEKELACEHSGENLRAAYDLGS